MNKNKITVGFIAFIAGFSTLFAAIIIFDIDLVKWVNCTAPFADQIDKESEICR